MKQNAISKINKMGQIGGYLTLVAKIFIIIGIVACLAGAVIFTIIPENFISINVSNNIGYSVDFSSLGIKFDESQIQEAQDMITTNGSITTSVNDNGTKYIVNNSSITENGISGEATTENVTMNLSVLPCIFLAGSINIAMALVTLFFVGSLCKAFRYCESPFEENVIKKMQNLAISLIPWTIISSIADSFITNLINVGNFEFGISVDLNVVLVIILIFVLVYIFKYGAVLQRESDETL
ncbi:MAG: hypothetical protein IJA34_15595 [Lachnospiraceae bacterium]|nr:hypothetical protein [Lachnospiraceae bacterium]MBQ6995407.1 hypothetical protein [Lachnospiraceae bacterium]